MERHTQKSKCLHKQHITGQRLAIQLVTQPPIGLHKSIASRTACQCVIKGGSIIKHVFPKILDMTLDSREIVLFQNMCKCTACHTAR